MRFGLPFTQSWRFHWNRTEWNYTFSTCASVFLFIDFLLGRRTEARNLNDKNISEPFLAQLSVNDKYRYYIISICFCVKYGLVSLSLFHYQDRFGRGAVSKKCVSQSKLPLPLSIKNWWHGCGGITRDWINTAPASPLTSLALRASETIDAGTSVGSDAASTVLAAILAHRCRRRRQGRQYDTRPLSLSFPSLTSTDPLPSFSQLAYITSTLTHALALRALYCEHVWGF